MPTSTNRAIRYPAPTDVADVPVDMSEMAADLDNVASVYIGTLAGRGAVSTGAGTVKGKAGTIYVATDVGAVYVSTGAAWLDLGAGPAIPIGSSLEWAGAGDPADARFFLEDGRSLNSVTNTQYASLFTTIGTTFGGTGAGDFRLPDSRGRVTVGPDNMGTAAGAAGRVTTLNGRGNVGGVSDVTLILAQTPVHYHALRQQTGIGGGIPVGSTAPAGGRVAYNGTDPIAPAGADGQNLTTETAGSGSSHTNMMPYIVKNKIIRVS